MTTTGNSPSVVLVETEDGLATEVSLEALTFARGLGPVQAVVIGAEPGDGLLTQLGEHGVEKVHHAANERLAAYSAAAWAAVLVDVVGSAGAAVVLASGSPRGNEVLAHVAVRCEVAMAANVVAVTESQPLQVSRQVVGGSVLEEMRLSEGLAVVSVAGHACEPAPAGTPTTPELAQVEVALTDADLVARVVRTGEKPADESAALTSARVVVGAGRGAGSADGFTDLLELTELLGGALGASRVVTSLGWRPHHEQVGQTGSRISPDVYIACGISGAIQHWAGIQSAKTIIAINTDADAPMVTKAHYAVIGDLHEVVPAINAELRRRTG